MALEPTSTNTDITHVIQLAIAPVFLLTAVGTTLNVLTNRLARIVDRGRELEARASDQPVPALHLELALLERRARLIYLAITFAVVAALLVCLLIATAFSAYLLKLVYSWALATLFMGAMVAYTGSLLSLLREVFLALSGFRLGVPPSL